MSPLAAAIEHLAVLAESTSSPLGGDSAEAMAKLIDDKTTAVFCESIGNPAGNIVDIEKLAAAGRLAGPALGDLCGWLYAGNPLALWLVVSGMESPLAAFSLPNRRKRSKRRRAFRKAPSS